MSALQFNAGDAVRKEDDNPWQKFPFYSNGAAADATAEPTCCGTNCGPVCLLNLSDDGVFTPQSAEPNSEEQKKKKKKVVQA